MVLETKWESWVTTLRTCTKEVGVVKYRHHNNIVHTKKAL